MMKKPKIESKPPRTFRDAVEVFLAKGGAFPDISLAGFLVEHAGMDRHASIASIGPVPHVEALALNRTGLERGRLCAAGQRDAHRLAQFCCGPDR